jgi:hypothetical protein
MFHGAVPQKTHSSRTDAGRHGGVLCVNRKHIMVVELLAARSTPPRAGWHDGKKVANVNLNVSSTFCGRGRCIPTIPCEVGGENGLVTDPG